MTNAAKIFSTLDNCRFCDGISKMGKAVEKTIREMWDTGELPYKQNFQWVAGYTVYHSFFGTKLYPILVGPAKPSKFRPHYSITHVSTPR